MIRTIGVIGGGQLGRMLALDAKRMGYDVVTLDPQPHSPCGQVSDDQIVAAYDDLDAIEMLGSRTDIVTYEFENISLRSVRHLEARGFSVAPSSSVLQITQNRIAEKRFGQQCGIAVAPFRAITSEDDVRAAAAEVGFPAVMKTVSGGYDGKGQWYVRELNAALDAFGEAATDGDMRATIIFERQVPFSKEISVICTRGRDGDVVTYPPAENEHDGGILSVSIAPARVAAEAAQEAREKTARLARTLEMTGTLCAEFFVHDDELLLNEIAPRPHNSGHYTIDAARCSQYEQHIRAICGLPLSPPQLLRNAVMVNILGDGTGNVLTGVDELLKDPSIVLHVYGKRHAVKRRKMGHFTMLVEGPITEDAIARAHKARETLYWSAGPISAHSA